MKTLKFLVVSVALLFGMVLSGGCTGNSGTQSVGQVEKDRVEVLYFHGPQRCRTCVALQNATKELVDTEFAGELKSGSVRFREIDLSSKEGEKLGDKYEIAWSSLIIVRHGGKKEKVADLTDDGFRYAVNNKEKIQSIISQKITEFLKTE